MPHRKHSLPALIFLTVLLAAPLRSASAQPAWTLQYASDLACPAFIDEATGWAWLGNGHLAKTTNGGTTWTAQLPPASNAGSSFGIDIEMLDASRGWALRNASFAPSQLWRTTDGGNSWQPVAPDTSVFSNAIQLAAFSAAEIGVLTASALWVSGDSGSSWQARPVTANGVEVSAKAIHFLSPALGWCVGTRRVVTSTQTLIYPALLHTATGGVSWQLQALPPSITDVDQIFFVDALHGWARGRKGTSVVLLRTVSGGASWSELPYPLPASINAFTFVSPDEGWSVGNNALLSHTTTGGETWESQSLGYGNALHAVRFLTPGTGFISGGRILLRTLTGGGMLSASSSTPPPRVSKPFSLQQNYPNPFNPETVIEYSVPQTGAAPIQLKVFDVLGREVQTLVNERKPSGNYRVRFNAAGLASGVYFYRLLSGDFIETRKMSVVK